MSKYQPLIKDEYSIIFPKKQEKEKEQKQSKIVVPKRKVKKVFFDIEFSPKSEQIEALRTENENLTKLLFKLKKKDCQYKRTLKRKYHDELQKQIEITSFYRNCAIELLEEQNKETKVKRTFSDFKK